MRLLLLLSLIGLTFGAVITKPAEFDEIDHQQPILREPREAFDPISDDKKLNKRSYGLPLLWPSYGLGHGLGHGLGLGYGLGSYGGWPSYGLHGISLGYSLPLYSLGHGYHGGHGGWHSKW